jgi:hypothetical protein
VRIRRRAPGLLGWLKTLRGGGAEAGAEKSGKNYPVKCDLCHGQRVQACVHHCPTGAVFRIDGNDAFEELLERPTQYPAASSLPLWVETRIENEPQPGRPAVLHATIRTEPAGLPLVCRRPESGVGSLVLNFYLEAPDDLRVGGGELRQATVPLSAPAGHAEYSLTGKGSGPFSVRLSVYQGGLYLGHTSIEVGFPSQPALAAQEVS